MVALNTTKPKSRLSFPFKEPEQWWEVWHNTERSLAAQFAMMPVNGVARRLLEDPAIIAKKNAAGRNKKAFEIATYEYLENVFTRTTGAQIIRSWTSLYGKDRKFQRCMHAGELLSGLTASAAHYDNEPLPLAEELQQGHVTPLHDFIFHSQDANELLSQFVSGELDATPTNLKQLEQHMQALAELSAQPLAMAQGMRQMSHDRDNPHNRPSDYIREVLEAKRLDTPRQLQILFSLVPPLITHGALALAHVEYVPQEKRFLSVDQSVKLAKAVEEMLDSQGYEYNHDGNGNPLLEEVSPNAIVKKSGNGYEPLSPEELLQFGNQLLHKTKEIAGQNLDRILAYADEHYEAVEKQLLNAVYPDISKAADIKASTALQSPKLAQPWQQEAVTPHSHKTNRWTSYLGAIWNNIVRPESVHEMSKLYRRKLPIQMTKMPINIIGDYLLRGGSKDIRSIQSGNWQPIAKKELWGLAANPVAGSHGLVGVKEIVSTGTQLTDASIKKLNRHFAAAIETGLQADADIQQSLQQARQTLKQRQFSVPPALKAKVEQIQQKDPRHYSPEDYQTLQHYFATMADQVNQQGDQLLSPYRKVPQENLPDIVRRNILQPVEDVPSALSTLSFVQSVLAKEVKNIHSLEFVDPQKNLLPVKSFRRIADYMEQQLTAAAIAVVGEDYQGTICQPPGFANGQMVQYNRQSGQYEAVKSETLIRLANVVADKFRQELGDKVQRLEEGRIDKTHFAFVEKALFSQKSEKDQPKPLFLPSGASPWSANTKPKRDRSVTEKVKAIVKHGIRPEAWHEATLLLSRTLYARFVGIPISVWQNIRRGYLPIDKETGKWKVNPEASITDIFTNPGKFISKGSLLSQLWGAFAYPIGEFVSTIGREMARYKVADTIYDTAHASDTMTEIIQKGKALSPDWEAEYSERFGKSAALEEMATQESAKMLPRIAMKPPHLRTHHEHELMEHFMQQAGAVTLSTASQMLANPRNARSSKGSVLQNPASNLAEAHETLATVKATMDASRRHLGVLRFVDKDKVLIDAKGLAELSATIEAQYEAAEKTGDLHSEQGFIRLANVIRDQFIAHVDLQKFQQSFGSKVSYAIS